MRHPKVSGSENGKKLRRRLKRNLKLRFAFRLCLQLGIDDPIAWMDNTPPWLLNAWMAYYTLEPWEVGSDPDEEKEKKMVSPEEAFNRLQLMVK